MRRRLLSVIIAVLGLVAIGLAVLSATVWRPSSTALAALPSAPASSYVVTQPGVLSLVDPDVTVEATAADPSTPVVIAVGRASDVAAWLGTDPYTRVTGLTDWETLSATEVTDSCQAAALTSAAPASAATAAATDGATAQADASCTALSATGADPTSSDLWLRTQTGAGKATLTLDAADSGLIVLVATNGTDPAPSVSLSWPRAVSTPWLVPGLVVGGLLVLVGVFGFVLDWQLRAQDAQRRARAAERAAHLAAADGVATAAIPQVGDPNRPLTRREKRDKERAEQMGEEWIDPRTGRVYLDGVAAPEVPTAQAAPAQEPSLEAALVAAEEGDHLSLAGTARGAAVVPALDEERTRAYRAARGELSEAEAYVAAPLVEEDSSTAEDALDDEEQLRAAEAALAAEDTQEPEWHAAVSAPTPAAPGTPAADLDATVDGEAAALINAALASSLDETTTMAPIDPEPTPDTAAQATGSSAATHEEQA